MALSLLEKMAAEIKTRLEEIDGMAPYTWAVKSVQRYKHTLDGREHRLPTLTDLPTIRMAVIAVDKEGLGPDVELGTWKVTATVEIELFLPQLEGGLDDDDFSAAVADLERAIYVLPWNGLGIGAVPLGTRNARFDLETGVPVDGVRLTASFQYRQDFQDPTI